MAELELDANFEAALEDCCRRLHGGESLERWVTAYPSSYRSELQRLAPLSLALGRIGHDPSPAFAARLERRLLTLSADTGGQKAAAARGLLKRFFTSGPAKPVLAGVTALMLLLGVGGFGAVRASRNSLPDSPLYVVQLLNDKAQVRLAPNRRAQIAIRARQVVALGGQLRNAEQTGKPPAVKQAIALRLVKTINQMVTQAIAERNDGDPQPAERVATLLQAMQKQLETAAPKAPPQQRPLLLRLHTFVVRQERRLATQPASEPAPPIGESSSPPSIQ